MGDPFSAQLMFQIEQFICRANSQTKEKGLALTDSQVRSALITTIKKLEGADPAIPRANDRDAILAELIETLCLASQDLGEKFTAVDGAEVEQDLAAADWTKAIEAVEHSLQIRKSPVPGSRCYLDYVQQLIADAKRHLQDKR
jgi:hypothetical protein